VRARLSSEELEACFTFEPFFRHLDALYARAAAPR